MVHTIRRPERDGTVRTGPHVAAFILLTGGVTMAFLAVATIAGREEWTLPALMAPGIVGFGLALQRRVPLTDLVGFRVRGDTVAAALVLGPFVVVLSMVLASEPRIAEPVAGWETPLRIVAASVAELGWWGYLFPIVRSRIPPVPSVLAVGLVWAGWHGLLASGGANPLAGVTPLLLVAWALAVAVMAGAFLELRPPSVIPVAAFQLGLTAAIALLPFTPAASGSSASMRTAAVVLVVTGAVILILARVAAVRRARHAGPDL